MVSKAMNKKLFTPIVLAPAILFITIIGVYVYANPNFFDRPPVNPSVLIEESEIRLRETLGSNPYDKEGYKALIELLIQSQQYEDASDIALQFSENIENLTIQDELIIAEAFILIDQELLLNDDVRQLLISVVNSDPANIKALWYLGLSYRLIDDLDNTSLYWTKLSELSPPEPLASFITEQLVSINSFQDVDFFDITIQPSLSSELSNKLNLYNASSRLYVIAKIEGQNIPLAVAQYEMFSESRTYNLNHTNVMIPGTLQNLPDSLFIEARLSFSGNPLSAAGDIYGVVLINRTEIGASSLSPLNIVIDSIY